MQYLVTHKTVYHYADAVPICHNLVHLAPRDAAYQVCEQHRLTISPRPTSLRRRHDYFGNQVDYFSIHEGHRTLTMTAVSRVELEPPPAYQPAQSPPWEQVRDTLRQSQTRDHLAAYQFAFNSPRVTTSQVLADYARVSFKPQRPILEAALDLTQRINDDFTFDPSATKVHTPLEEAFRLRRGVCQDLAHIQIGALRSIGIAARYVSGYLLTQPPPGQKRLVGADASHAWVSLFCGPLDWVDLDPTNNTLPQLEHITLAWGRDYGDVCPIQGVFIGGGAHTIQVAVDVLPQDEPEVSPTTPV